jgi:tRNA-specific 2-thiouridylase
MIGTESVSHVAPMSSEAPGMSGGTIAVAMSGGVDSSTVAAMLRDQGRTAGFDVIGLTLQLWDQNRLAGKPGVPEAPKAGRCCSLDDVYDARRVAETLDIPYYVVNQQERFENDVVRPFVNEYLNGRTPIPCSLCNNHLKFDQLLLTARQIGAEHIATGHYARNEYDPERGRWILKRPADRAKDQTWFLFGLTQDQLAHTLFPLGHLTKPEVREIARESKLPLADKPDSQEICFIPGGDYKQFIANYLEEQGRPMPDSSGELVTTAGKPLGKHEGVHNFTVGQRKGLGVTSPNPLYVLNIDRETRRITVGGEDELNTPTLHVNQLNWIAIPSLSAPRRAQVKIRHVHEPSPALLEPLGTDADGIERVRVTFDTPQRAITPGHSAVFYDGDEVLGGGWIY